MKTAQRTSFESTAAPRRWFFSFGGSLTVVAALATVVGVGIQVYDRFETKEKPVQTANSQTTYEAAKQLFYDNHVDAAAVEAREGVKVDPKNRDLHKLLAACYGVENKMEACATEYREAVRLNRHDDEALLGLGTALEALGDNAGAKDAYSRVVGDAGADPARKDHAKTRLVKL